MREALYACQALAIARQDGRFVVMAKRKNPAAVALGRLGGKAGGTKGGRARAAALTPEQRRESARQAARARWAKAKTKP
jgi:hypothetical protein